MVTRPSLNHSTRSWWVVPAVVAAFGWATPASAFYWSGWPGSGVNPPPSIVSETIKVEHRNPPPIVEPPGEGPEEPPEPNGVPEPATALLAGVGLAALAGLRRMRKRRNQSHGGDAT